MKKVNIDGILPKRPCPPCLRMPDKALDIQKMKLIHIMPIHYKHKAEYMYAIATH